MLENTIVDTIAQKVPLKRLRDFDGKMYRFSDPEFGDVSANAFNSMLGGVDLNSDAQAELAQEVIQAMLLGPPTTTPAIPTRTPDPDASTTTTEATTTDVPATTSTTTEGATTASDCEKEASEIHSTQTALQSMLNAECATSRTPEEAEMRFALARVAGKLISGDEETIRKWKCYEKLVPQNEGPQKTLRQMEEYILSFVGCVNISAEENRAEAASSYYNPNMKLRKFDHRNNPDPERYGIMSFNTYGDDFGKIFCYKIVN